VQEDARLSDDHDLEVAREAPRLLLVPVSQVRRPLPFPGAPPPASSCQQRTGNLSGFFENVSFTQIWFRQPCTRSNRDLKPGPFYQTSRQSVGSY
jgi:hypothetical protein